MGSGLGIAGLICVALALGHATIGLVWVLPRVREERLPGSPFESMIEGMVGVSWHVVTIFALGSGGLLISLAAAPLADPRLLLLRWFAAMWVAATAMALWVKRKRPRELLRLPVWVLWIVVAALCWNAST